MIRSLALLLTFVSSAAFAQEHRFGLGTQLGIHGGVPVAGAEVVMPVNDDMQLSYAYVQGQTSLVNEVDPGVATYLSTADFSLSEASVTLRWFTSRTFYVGAGAGYRVLDLDMKGFDFVDRTDFEGEYDSQALQAKILIGNSWNFASGFYLGVDWIGLAAPIAVTKSELSATETNLDRSQRLYRSDENDDEYKRVANKISRSTMGTLLTLRLGFNF